MDNPDHDARSARTGFLIALLLVAANLRPVLTGVGPLLPQIQQQLTLSATAAGLLTSLPLVMFAVAAPLAGFARRHGAERLMLGALLALGAGTALRSAGGTPILFAGTVLLASGIAVANVLMPTLVKQHFPHRITTVTTAYATVMGSAAGLASGISVPLATILPGGWRGSMACWAGLTFITILLWLGHLRPASPPTPPTPESARRPLWREPLAWQVTAFMGLQSTLFYTVVTWFPVLLSEEAGLSQHGAGWLLTLYQLVGIVAGLAIPVLIRRQPDQRHLALAISLFAVTGVLGMLLAPRWALLWMGLMGMSSGPSLILALTFVALRARNAQVAGALSLMAQGLGYLIAAFGPVIFGLLRDVTGGWTTAMGVLVLVGIAQGIFGYQAGRLRKV